MIQGNDANPNTTPAIIDALRGFNPWIEGADFDHHGYGRVKASQTSFDCELVRMATIKQHSRATLPATADYHVSCARGQKSILT